MTVTIWTDEQAGTGSYSTGGFTVTTGLASVDHISAFVKVPGANLSTFTFEYVRNSPAAGQIKVLVKKLQYDKSPANLGSPSGLPAGVTAPTTSGQTYDANTTHVHSMAHDHGAVTSGAMSPSGGGVVTGVAAGNYDAHTHSADPPNFTGNTGAGVSHTHTWDNIYQHQHTPTNTQSNILSTEIAAGTDLSGATFYFRAVGS